MRVSLVVVVIAFVLSLASCTPFGSDAGSRPPQTNLNPHPVQAYRVSLTVKDAPGPFRKVEGIVDYAAKHRDDPARTCGYMAGGVGAFVALGRSEFFELKKVAEDTYEGVVYADGMLDEDYDGEGVCHWEMVEIRARLSANDDLTNTRFAPFMSVPSGLTEKSERRYFWKGTYANQDFRNHTSFGQTEPTKINRSRDELFVVTIAAREILP